MVIGEMIGYADGGVVSKQVLKSEAGNITLFSFDRDQGLSEHTAPFDAWVQFIATSRSTRKLWKRKLRLTVSLCVWKQVNL